MKEHIKEFKVIGIGISIYLLCDVLSRIYELKVKHIPPGPIGLPLIGSFIPYFKDQCAFYYNLAINYGSIVSFKRFNKTIIMINDSKILKEIMIKSSYKSNISITKSISTNFNHDGGSLSTVDGTQSLFMINGEQWKNRRQKAYKLLMKIINTRYLDNVLSKSIQNTLFPHINKYKTDNKQIWYDYHDIFEYLAFNTLYHCNFGEQISMNDKYYKIIMNDINETLSYFPISLMIIKQPWLKYTFLRRQYQKINQMKVRRETNLKYLIQQRKMKLNESKKDTETYIDNALKEMSESEAIADILLLFAAGVETTSNTLDFGLVLIANDMEIQNKVRDELKNVYGDNNFDLSLINKCPLYRALVWEILRISAVAGTPGLRHVAHDIYLECDGENYCIPKGSSIHYNISWIQRYSKSEGWNDGDVNKICLENWLDEDNKFKMNNSFVGFGLGKRNCLGMKFAVNEIFYILAFMILNYKFRIAAEDEMNVSKALNNMRPFSRTLEPKIGIIVE